MKAMQELHEKAMDLAQRALLFRQQGAVEQADILARDACVYESHAADLLPAEPASEPLRSLLYLSAASLAYQCQDFQTTRNLARKGLRGFPSAEIRRDLHDLDALASVENTADMLWLHQQCMRTLNRRSLESESYTTAQIREQLTPL